MEKINFIFCPQKCSYNTGEKDSDWRCFDNIELILGLDFNSVNVKLIIRSDDVLRQKHFPGLGVLFILPFVLECCISLKIKPSPPPENLVEFVCFCTSVEEGPDRLEPKDIRNEFPSNSEEVRCFVRLKDVSQEIVLRWKWYSPDLKLKRDTGDFLVNQAGEYLELVTAYDRLTIPEWGTSMSEGEWVVTIFVNDHLASKKSFTVVKQEPSNMACPVPAAPRLN